MREPRDGDHETTKLLLRRRLRAVHYCLGRSRARRG
jgi:hypothetical protein